MITGVTSNKLDIISTYDVNPPFQVGINGVTKIEYDSVTLTAITRIHYTIDNINYITDYIEGPTPEQSYPTIFFTNSYSFDPNKKFNTPPKYNFDEYTYIKEENKMGMVFPPKVKSDLFIDRMSSAVFERHSRLGEITNLTRLVEYRNGYYNIVTSI